MYAGHNGRRFDTNKVVVRKRRVRLSRKAVLARLQPARRLVANLRFGKVFSDLHNDHLQAELLKHRKAKKLLHYGARCLEPWLASFKEKTLVE